MVFSLKKKYIYVYIWSKFHNEKDKFLKWICIEYVYIKTERKKKERTKERKEESGRPESYFQCAVLLEKSDILAKVLHHPNENDFNVDSFLGIKIICILITHMHAPTTNTHTHIYIYIYIERERERERWTNWLKSFWLN